MERYTWNLARRCVAAGHRALIVTSALPGLPARERDAWGLEIYRLPALPVMGGRFPVLRPFAPAADLWAQGIDFAVIQTRMYTQSVLGRAAVPQAGHPRPWSSTIPPATMMHGGLGRCAGALVRTSGLRHHPPVQQSSAAYPPVQVSLSTVSPAMSAAG